MNRTFIQYASAYFLMCLGYASTLLPQALEGRMRQEKIDLVLKETKHARSYREFKKNNLFTTFPPHKLKEILFAAIYRLANTDPKNRALLFAYNYARELTGKEAIHFSEDIDMNWVDKEEYNTLKVLCNSHYNKTPLRQQKKLIENILENIKLFETLCISILFRSHHFTADSTGQVFITDFQNVPREITTTEGYDPHTFSLKIGLDQLVANQNLKEIGRDIIFAYNMLADLHARTRIETLSEIDLPWLTELYPLWHELLKEFLYYYYVFPMGNIALGAAIMYKINKLLQG